MTVALLDACVLYPASLRDLLLWLATEFVYSPRWTNEIHEEWIGSLIEKRPTLSRLKLERTRELMNLVDPNCLVEGYERHIAGLLLPDAEDRHVAAAAIEAHADVLVTFNLSDFPEDALASFGIRVEHPDTFLCSLIEEKPEQFLVAVKHHQSSLSRPPKTVEEYLEALETNGLTELVTRLRKVAAERR